MLVTKIFSKNFPSVAFYMSHKDYPLQNTYLVVSTDGITSVLEIVPIINVFFISK